MWTDDDLQAATERAKDTCARADAAGISAELLAQVELMGGSLDDAHRLFSAAVAQGVSTNLLALHTVAIIRDREPHSPVEGGPASILP